MTMLDRYLSAVQNDLPKDQPANDIVAEIGDDLRSQIEEREHALGRGLTDDEVAGVLKAYGHPRTVAAGYARVRYLIGPELLPFYWSALRAVATVIVALELITGAISALASHNGTMFFDALDAAWHSLVWIFAIVTVVFAVLERAPQPAAERNLPFMRWDPRRLPATYSYPPVPRQSSIVEFIANFMALLVLLDAGNGHRIPLTSMLLNVMQQLHVSLTPAWNAAYTGALAGTALITASAIVVFILPRLTLVHECIRIIASVCTIVGIALTLHDSPLLQGASATVNAGVSYAMIGGIAALGVQIAVSLRTLLRTGDRVAQRNYSAL